MGKGKQALGKKQRKVKRKIIRIDEEKCNGCGNCVVNCLEGALRIIDGKAKLVNESFCDGLGACIGECPTGALVIEEREADSFDEEAVKKHLEEEKKSTVETALPCGCPGTAVKEIRREEKSSCNLIEHRSQLKNWPVQIHLVPPNAPYLKGAKLLVAADCTPCAFADFHNRFLKGRVLLLGCPKLHDAEFYRLKLSQIFKENKIESVNVVFMEVPCCFGLVDTVQRALGESGAKVPIDLTKVGINGEVLETKRVDI